MGCHAFIVLFILFIVWGGYFLTLFLRVCYFMDACPRVPSISSLSLRQASMFWLRWELIIVGGHVVHHKIYMGENIL